MANTQTTVPLFVANQVLTANQQNLSAGTGVPVFATTVTRDAAFGGSNKALAEGQLCYLESTDVVQQYNGSSWVTVGPATAVQSAIFNETQTVSTAGGASVANAWTKRVLNTTNYNTITGCSIASSVITLAAGTYSIQAFAPFYNSGGTKIKLRNTTDSTDAIIGQNNYVGTTSTATAIASLTEIITIAGTKNFELQYWVENAVATQGLGVTVSGSGVSAIYAIIEIEKIA